MKSQLRHIYHKYIKPKAIVLMYHRVANLESDIWDITVSPSNFEQHLQVIKELKSVVPLNVLALDVKKKNIRKNSVAISFDDGYADNFTEACPLLEKYGIPATFFISSINIDTSNLFWWDELEQIILYKDSLPQRISIVLGEQLVVYNLQEEAILTENKKSENKRWKAYLQLPPSRRCELYLILWRLLKPLPHNMQKQSLQKIKHWAGLQEESLIAYQSMTGDQLQALSRNKLFDVGAHTTSHLSLPLHTRKLQESEIIENKNFLQASIGKNVKLLSYPYGDYNDMTVAATASAAFDAAFTTAEQVVTNHSNQFLIPRFQVKNWDGKEFQQQLNKWLLK
ncbi:polysaccharide deacetylase family protein [Pontibacter ramchanderi]|uniref:Polysaccharide deacetylase n=1 Tax=Pontibacter ramchanderi TaxID=1179743 RepID=A0A2N3U7Q6_9BACT|nr:polysaccharide deacetylase family protein [Pontibacter ramchanderi]PKV62783.1 polysaccharide deacetylase [Pontibacter ramchanderi]